MAGNGVSGARPISSKLTSVDRRQAGLQHVTHAPATPRDWRSAIVGGAMVTAEGSVAASVAGHLLEFPIFGRPSPPTFAKGLRFVGD
jgi:hypothetical protein